MGIKKIAVLLLFLAGSSASSVMQIGGQVANDLISNDSDGSYFYNGYPNATPPFSGIKDIVVNLSLADFKEYYGDSRADIGSAYHDYINSITPGNSSYNLLNAEKDLSILVGTVLWDRSLSTAVSFLSSNPASPLKPGSKFFDIANFSGMRESQAIISRLVEEYQLLAPKITAAMQVVCKSNQRVDIDGKCSCIYVGQEMDPAGSGNCITMCSDDETRIGGYPGFCVQNITCTGNKFKYDDQCYDCPSGQVPNSDHTSCDLCPSGKVPNSDGTACVAGQLTCPGGSVLQGSQCICPSTSAWDGSECACSGNKRLVNNVCIAPPPPVCTSNQVLQNNICVTCSAGSEPNAAKTNCILSSTTPASCSGGQTMVNGQCKCLGGQILNTSGQCVCPSGQAIDSGTGLCAVTNACPGIRVKLGSGACGCPDGYVEGANDNCVKESLVIKVTDKSGNDPCAEITGLDVLATNKYLSFSEKANTAKTSSGFINIGESIETAFAASVGSDEGTSVSNKVIDCTTLIAGASAISADNYCTSSSDGGMNLMTCYENKLSLSECQGLHGDNVKEEGSVAEKEGLIYYDAKIDGDYNNTISAFTEDFCRAQAAINKTLESAEKVFGGTHLEDIGTSLSETNSAMFSNTLNTAKSTINTSRDDAKEALQNRHTFLNQPTELEILINSLVAENGIAIGLVLIKVVLTKLFENKYKENFDPNQEILDSSARAKLDKAIRIYKAGYPEYFDPNGVTVKALSPLKNAFFKVGKDTLTKIFNVSEDKFDAMLSNVSGNSVGEKIGKLVDISIKFADEAKSLVGGDPITFKAVAQAIEENTDLFKAALSDPSKIAEFGAKLSEVVKRASGADGSAVIDNYTETITRAGVDLPINTANSALIKTEIEKFNDPIADTGDVYIKKGNDIYKISYEGGNPSTITKLAGKRSTSNPLARASLPKGADVLELNSSGMLTTPTDGTTGGQVADFLINKATTSGYPIHDNDAALIKSNLKDIGIDISGKDSIIIQKGTDYYQVTLESGNPVKITKLSAPPAKGEGSVSISVGGTDADPVFVTSANSLADLSSSAKAMLKELKMPVSDITPDMIIKALNKSDAALNANEATIDAIISDNHGYVKLGSDYGQFTKDDEGNYEFEPSEGPPSDGDPYELPEDFDMNEMMGE